MTATVGAGPQETLPAPPGVPATTPDQPRPDAERQRQLLQALTTEHFTLQTARSATIADSNGRSALYLSTVSSAVVALAFIGQIAHLGQAFHLFALALLPALVLLGILTYLRLVQTAIEDLFYARAINRIRRHYLDLDPAAGRWFVLSGFDDPAGVMAAMGLTTPGAAALAWASVVACRHHGRGGHQHHRRGGSGPGSQRGRRRPGAGGRQRRRGRCRRGDERGGVRVASAAPLAGRRGQRPQPVPLPARPGAWPRPAPHRIQPARTAEDEQHPGQLPPCPETRRERPRDAMPSAASVRVCPTHRGSFDRRTAVVMP